MAAGKGSIVFGLTISGVFVSFGRDKTPSMWKMLIITRGRIMAAKLTPITPGDVLLEEFLKPMKISQNQLAKDIHVPANRISQIIHGKREITADTALRLGTYFGIEPEFWLNLQVRYNMKIAKRKVGKIIEKEVKYHFAQTNRRNLVTT